MNLTLFFCQRKETLSVHLPDLSTIINRQLYINPSQPAAQLLDLLFRCGHLPEWPRFTANMMREIPCGYVGPSYSTHIRIAHLRDIQTKGSPGREICSSRCLASSQWRALHELAGLLEMTGKMIARG